MDLTDSERTGKSRDIRFVDRVFTPAEIDLIRSSDDPDGMLWTLWTGKEAAYKVMSKSHPLVSSAPGRYDVELENRGVLFPCRGVASTPAGSVALRFCRSREMVHAVGSEACEDIAPEPVWGVEVVDRRTAEGLRDDPSLLVRESLIRRLSVYPGYENSEMEIRRCEGPRGMGPPGLYICGNRSGVDISLSHDGRFIAYAFILSGASMVRTISATKSLSLRGDNFTTFSRASSE